MRSMRSEAQIEEARLAPLTEPDKAEVGAVVEGPPPAKLKRRAARGAIASSASQAATLPLRMVSMVIMARRITHPAGSILAGIVVAMLLTPWVSKVEWPLLRLTIASSILFGTYPVVLLLAFGQERVCGYPLQQTGL